MHASIHTFMHAGMRACMHVCMYFLISMSCSIFVKSVEFLSSIKSIVYIKIPNPHICRKIRITHGAIIRHSGVLNWLVSELPKFHIDIPPRCNTINNTVQLCNVYDKHFVSLICSFSFRATHTLLQLLQLTHLYDAVIRTFPQIVDNAHWRNKIPLCGYLGLKIDSLRNCRNCSNLSKDLHSLQRNLYSTSCDIAMP